MHERHAPESRYLTKFQTWQMMTEQLTSMAGEPQYLLLVITKRIYLYPEGMVGL